MTSAATPDTAAPARPWLGYALATTVFFGVWGALIEIPEKAGFPATLGYSVWALTMIPCALLALRLKRTTIERDTRSIALGLAAGIFGAGGQLILFEALRTGPAYIVFPVVSIYPALTIVLSLWLLRERARLKAWTGILLAIPAVALLSYSAADDSLVQGYGWLVLAIAVFVLWGAQAYILKLANATMSAEGIFAYMAGSAVLLVPVALWMTDFSKPITWGFEGPYLAALIHVLNAVGALMLVYALRWGKAIIVVPMTALAPVLTIVLSLMIYGRVPLPEQVLGLVLATVAIFLMSE